MFRSTMFSMAHLNFEVASDNDMIHDQAANAFKRFFFAQESRVPQIARQVTIVVRDGEPSFEFTASATKFAESSGLSVYKNGQHYFLAKKNAVFQLDLEQSVGQGSLGPRFWEESLRCQQEFLMLVLLWLFRKHGVYSVHANAVSDTHRSVLFLGASGSGKSTSALNLIRCGWNYLSDDVTLLRSTDAGIEAAASQKWFSVSPRHLSQAPELETRAKPVSFYGEKSVVDIRNAYPEKFRLTCLPNTLIFPQIVSSEESALVPLGKAQSLTLLSQCSGGIMIDRRTAGEQMKLLARLVHQAPSYHLLAGRDLYRDSLKLQRLLALVSS